MDPNAPGFLIDTLLSILFPLMFLALPPAMCSPIYFCLSVSPQSFIPFADLSFVAHSYLVPRRLPSRSLDDCSLAASPAPLVTLPSDLNNRLASPPYRTEHIQTHNQHSPTGSHHLPLPHTTA